VPVAVEIEARLARGVERVDLRVRVENAARDHRLRLLFPSGAPAAEFLAATTFDLARRVTTRPDAAGWVHGPPATFPHQGFVAAGGLTVLAPGLPEAEVSPDGVIAITLLRAVGWLARMDLTTRPQIAGPTLPTPGAQCLTAIEAQLALLPFLDMQAARDCELGLRAVVAGQEALVPPERSLLEVTPREVVLSALKPAEQSSGIILRLLNPSDDVITARVRLGFPAAQAVAVRLDESEAEDGDSPRLRDGELRIVLPPHALRSVLLRR
jgi:alpha-mannosidase